MRIEKDTLGEVRVPDDALYGAQTQRAVENYPISGLREHPAVHPRVHPAEARGGAGEPRARRDGRDASPTPSSRACDRILARLRALPAALRRRRLPGRRRHVVQHELQRGDRQPREPLPRRQARRVQAGASERSRQHVAVDERRVPDRACAWPRAVLLDELHPALDAPRRRARRERRRVRGRHQVRPHASRRTRFRSRSARSSRPTPRRCGARRGSCATPAKKLRRPRHRRHRHRHRHQHAARLSLRGHPPPQRVDRDAASIPPTICARRCSRSCRSSPSPRRCAISRSSSRASPTTSACSPRGR